MVNPPASGSPDDAPEPAPVDFFATRLEDGHVVQGWAGALILPSPERAQIVIRQGLGGVWLAEQGALCHPVADGNSLELTGERWRLTLPAPAPPEPSAPEAPAPWELYFQVDADEMRISMTVKQDELGAELGVQAHLRPLYALARDRLRGRRRGLGPDDAGWMGADDLAHGLEISTSSLFVQLWRLRRQLEQLGVPEADRVVQARSDGALRVGTDRITITKVG